MLKFFPFPVINFQIKSIVSNSKINFPQLFPLSLLNHDCNEENVSVTVPSFILEIKFEFPIQIITLIKIKSKLKTEEILKFNFDVNRSRFELLLYILKIKEKRSTKEKEKVKRIKINIRYSKTFHLRTNTSIEIRSSTFQLLLAFYPEQEA